MCLPVLHVCVPGTLCQCQCLKLSCAILSNEGEGAVPFLAMEGRFAPPTKMPVWLLSSPIVFVFVYVFVFVFVFVYIFVIVFVIVFVSHSH